MDGKVETWEPQILFPRGVAWPMDQLLSPLNFSQILLSISLCILNCSISLSTSSILILDSSSTRRISFVTS